MKKIENGKLKWLLLFIVSSVGAIAAIIFLAVSYLSAHSVDKYLEAAYRDVGAVSPTEEGLASASDFNSPIDFESLWAVNKDIYAWIEIPDTNINYPVAQKKMNDEYYLNHAIDGSKDKKGTLFTESLFNGTDFNDPVTVIYGHDMKNGSMFGRLQNYSKEAYFNKHTTIKVYMPEKTLTYKVFAAVPFSGKHILYSWDFDDENQFNNFIRTVRSTKSLLVNFNYEIEVTSSDKLLILSTCLKSDNSKRYLVMAVLTDEQK
ncbi:MAG: class B sortase [Firmicutes bacterium]|nr:class B sortase [Bacillota bacterium]